MARADHALRKLRDGAVGLRRRELLLADQESLQRLAVEAGVFPPRQVAEILVAEPLPQKPDDAVLHRVFGRDPDARVGVLRFAACGEVIWLLIHSYSSCLRFCASPRCVVLRFT